MTYIRSFCTSVALSLTFPRIPVPFDALFLLPDRNSKICQSAGFGWFRPAADIQETGRERRVDSLDDDDQHRERERKREW